MVEYDNEDRYQRRGFLVQQSPTMKKSAKMLEDIGETDVNGIQCIFLTNRLKDTVFPGYALRSFSATGKSTRYLLSGLLLPSLIVGFFMSFEAR